MGRGKNDDLNVYYNAAMKFLNIHQVGLSEDDKVYIACGENMFKYNGIKLLSMEQLKEYTNVLFYSQLCIIMLYI